MSFEQSDQKRRLHNIIRTGTIADVDYQNWRIKIKTGGITSAWLPHPAEVGNNYIRWSPLKIGQQVRLACPSGDINNAFVIAHDYDANHAPPSTATDTDIIQFTDGSKIEKTATTLTIHSAGDLNLTADGNITINGARVDIN